MSWRQTAWFGGLAQLYIGLILYGASCALMVRARLGLDPWDVFHQGVSRRVGWSIGTVVIVAGLVVLLCWIPLRQFPGLGTVSNVVLVGLSIDGALGVLPTPGPLVLRIGYLAGGVVLCGVATGLYIGANFGPGPRDGLMTGLVRRTGWSIRSTRTGIEATVLARRVPARRHGGRRHRRLRSRHRAARAGLLTAVLSSAGRGDRPESVVFVVRAG